MATRRDLFEIEAQVPRGTLVYLAPERIEPNPRQPRQQLSRAGLEELKASISTRGILQALLGVRGESGRVTLIAGHRRWQAARELGLARVPIILVDNRQDGADPLLDAIIENVQRENLAPWEEGESYRQLANEFGWDHKQIAASIGKSRPYVTQRIRAAENLSPAVKEFFLTGDVAVLFQSQNGVTAASDSYNVTTVTPSDKNHKWELNQEDKATLAAFLNNVELVRRLTALEPEMQLEAVRQSVEEALQTGRSLNLNDLALRLKSYRDQKPSSKAHLKSGGSRTNNNGMEQLVMDLDLAELEVIRWTARELPETVTREPSRQWDSTEIDRLITRYESDLAKLRRWRERQNTAG
ncbi:MAG TPA: ParB/RepB/Spo0J family partition protein [Chloroflexia bacterium]|nr:ParB/RepB/Spo0J family partition protein [Chloroflexia bacterium]